MVAITASGVIIVGGSEVELGEGGAVFNFKIQGKMFFRAAESHGQPAAALFLLGAEDTWELGF